MVAQEQRLLIPMVHKNEDSKRSHFFTFEATIPDAPRADEIVVAIGVSTAGRPIPENRKPSPRYG